MSTALDFTGKAVVITGGTGGIGLGLARGFAQAGANVIATGATAAEVETAGQVSGVGFAVLDVRSDDAVAAFARSLPKVDVLVNCAGVNLRAAEYTPQGFASWSRSAVAAVPSSTSPPPSPSSGRRMRRPMRRAKAASCS